jgi:hypothetical protein
MQITEDDRLQMLEDIKTSLGPVIPEGAWTAQELADQTGGQLDKIRRQARKMVDEGKWLSARGEGGVLYYWPVK